MVYRRWRTDWLAGGPLLSHPSRQVGHVAAVDLEQHLCVAWPSWRAIHSGGFFARGQPQRGGRVAHLVWPPTVQAQVPQQRVADAVAEVLVVDGLACAVAEDVVAVARGLLLALQGFEDGCDIWMSRCELSVLVYSSPPAQRSRGSG